ncbi:MAG TPA: amidohydrolase family protein [Acidimicrobiia bacterium]|nr:amidohydrolase family protein [Acidimicrobiia bacterium]
MIPIERESAILSQVIDIHCHRECSPAAALVNPEAERLGKKPLRFGSELTKEVNRRQLEALRPKMESTEERISDMDAMGVDVQALSVSPYHMFFWAEGELGDEAFRIINDDLAELVDSHPDRFTGLGAVPLQNPGNAVIELRRCIEDLGFGGIETSTHVEGEELTSSRFEPFWETAEELGAVIFIHPTGFTDPARFTEHYFFNTIGHPLEETICAGRLIFDGVMERHPDLKIVFAHGGGFLPAYAGRFDHAYHAREDVRHGLPRPPSEYLSMFYFDTMVFEPDQLGFLIDKYGADRILLGTDYPYDMGESDPLGLIKSVSGLSSHDIELIAGGNAARLLGLEREPAPQESQGGS